MKLTVSPFDLQLSDPFQTSHGRRTVQPTLIVSLTDEGTKLTGLGEAPMTSYYGLRSDACTAVLHSLAPAFAQKKLSRKSTVASVMNPIDVLRPNLNPFLRCALDAAAHDLIGKFRRLRTGAAWTVDEPRSTPTCYTIGLASISEMVRKLREKPWPVYKIKLGETDALATVEALRKHTDAPFYVDANTGWTEGQTIEYSHVLKDLGVVFIEQPTKNGSRKMYEESALPLVADESCQTETDVAKCAEFFHGINIKIVKCGGLAPARRMITEARTLGMKVMAGCMTESSVGISAIAQLLPELDYADMDGAMLIANDPAAGVTFDPVSGLAHYPGRFGNGALLLSPS